MKNHFRLFITAIITVFLGITLSGQRILAEDQSSAHFLSRGEVVAQVTETFDLKNKHKDFIEACFVNLDDCFFVFSAMTDFDAIQFHPIILYPDVSVAYRYYDDITIATMLGLVHGYLDEDQSPFHPRALMSRIEALKVVLGARGFLDWKERFEMMATLGEDGLRSQKTIFNDVSAENPAHWWYPRYVNFAFERGIIKSTMYFRPDEFITDAELNEMIDRAKARK